MTIVSLLFLFTTQSFALESTHQVRPNGSFETAVLNSSCSTMLGTSSASRCNSALFPYNDTQAMEFVIIGKAEGDSINNGYDLIFKPITEDLVRKLFREENFNSFTFNSDLVFKTKWFELSYSPYYLLADIYLFNPVFPEVAINAVNQETLRLTSGVEIAKSKILNGTSLSVGSSLFYYSHKYENTIFSLYELSFKKPEELINFKTTNGIAADLGLFLKNETIYVPNIALQAKNNFTKIKKNNFYVRSSVRLQSLYLFETYTQLALGKGIDTFLGKFDFNVELPFSSYFKEADYNQLTLGSRYNLGLFSFLFSINQFYQNIGLKFDSQNFNIGVTYSKEKDIGKIQKTYEDTVYTGIEVNL